MKQFLPKTHITMTHRGQQSHAPTLRNIAHTSNSTKYTIYNGFDNIINKVELPQMLTCFVRPVVYYKSGKNLSATISASNVYFLLQQIWCYHGIQFGAAVFRCVDTNKSGRQDVPLGRIMVLWVTLGNLDDLQRWCYSRAISSPLASGWALQY